MLAWGFLLLPAAPVLAQEARAEQVRLAMQGSVGKQKASVARQARRLRAGSGPRPGPVALPADLLLPGPVTPPRPRGAQTAALACPPVAAGELNTLIGEAAHINQVDAAVVREVVRQESAFRPCAVSSKGAEGLMQLMPATQALLGVGNPFDPRESLMAGAKLLRQLLERYDGNLALALSAYNAGPGRVDRTMSIPAIPETRDYVSQILDRLGQ